MHWTTVGVHTCMHIACGGSVSNARRHFAYYFSLRDEAKRAPMHTLLTTGTGACSEGGSMANGAH